MGKIAFVFSGQGDQYPGMGKELCMKYPVASDVYGMCDSIRPNTSKQCFEGAQEELKETKNTQPCLFAMELASASVLIDKGIKPDALAGFSLGEVAAVTVGGIFDNETGFSLVCKRGELMQREAEKFDTSMAAVVKLTASKVQELCDKYEGIYAVNYNCPGQIAVSGLSSQMDEFSSDVKAAGGRAIPLKVRGAFHYRITLAPQGLTDGMTVQNGAGAEVRVGNCLPLSEIPVGTQVHNIELYPGKGGQLVRSAGNSAQLMAKEGKYATLRLPSGEMRMVPIVCRATIGVVGNAEHSLINLGKAGRKRHMGIRPTVRGSVMNPNDHPHGGGEGRAPVGRPSPMTPWGKPAMGLKTRKKNKQSNKLIIRRRDGKAIK